MQEFYVRTRNTCDTEEEKPSITKTAARVLKTELLAMASAKEVCHSADEISLQNNMKYIPEYLQLLLKTVPVYTFKTYVDMPSNSASSGSKNDHFATTIRSRS